MAEIQKWDMNTYMGGQRADGWSSKGVGSGKGGRIPEVHRSSPTCANLRQLVTLTEKCNLHFYVDRKQIMQNPAMQNGEFGWDRRNVLGPPSNTDIPIWLHREI
ncbi:hypothetical protein CDAR_309771 [Caerostris darwini]|uniref:Uncharacterized protein n=1 Tax=Caerostris darwini TaxID=1538125 RepID=A0AAV4VZ00_9ARAC|nr:hypothetical protein CDAR_309771 [Caerostris darwini]